jgi:hypothetical protein
MAPFNLGYRDLCLPVQGLIILVNIHPSEVCFCSFFLLVLLCSFLCAWLVLNVFANPWNEHCSMLLTQLSTTTYLLVKGLENHHQELNMLSFLCGATHWMLLTLRKQSCVCCRFLSLKRSLFDHISLCLFVYFVWVSSVQWVQDNGLCDNSRYKRGIKELNFWSDVVLICLCYLKWQQMGGCDILYLF